MCSSVEVAESCCATILAQLRAAEMGLPFLPVRGVRGSDIGRLHPEYAEVTCPFTGETLVAVPALRPDAALLHAPAGDRYGNLHLEQPYVLDERFAAASAMVVATVDELVSTDDVVAFRTTVSPPLVVGEHVRISFTPRLHHVARVEIVDREEKTNGTVQATLADVDVATDP